MNRYRPGLAPAGPQGLDAAESLPHRVVRTRFFVPEQRRPELVALLGPDVSVVGQQLDFNKERLLLDFVHFFVLEAAR